MKNGKSPGIDGLPICFYKYQYDILEHDLLQLYNSIIFHKENLTPSLNKAIITLVLKKWQKELLKSWRPIPLLCADYKFLNNFISNRHKWPLEHAISKEQTNGIPNRFIFSNRFTIGEILSQSITKTVQPYIVSVDQYKTFDKVD